MKPIKRDGVRTEGPSRPVSEGNLAVVGNSVAGLWISSVYRQHNMTSSKREEEVYRFIAL